MNLLNNNRGQSTSEYILIIVLVVIAVVVSLHLFGSTVKSKFFGAGDSVKDTDNISSGTGYSSDPDTGSVSDRAGSNSSNSPAARGQEFLTPNFGNEEAIAEIKAEQQKAWFKTILVFAVAGAVLLMLVFMTLERIKMIKKQMAMQQEMDDMGRGKPRKPITFKRPLKPKD